MKALRLQGLTHEEIAKRLGCRVQIVSYRLLRPIPSQRRGALPKMALKRIRERFKEAGGNVTAFAKANNYTTAGASVALRRAGCKLRKPGRPKKEKE